MPGAGAQAEDGGKLRRRDGQARKAAGMLSRCLW